ncbi:MAG: hypothetical protein ACI9XR_001922 [Flavobacterium sp.]|jgi:hypothetical protein
MKKILLLYFLLFATLSCKKKDQDNIQINSVSKPIQKKENTKTEIPAKVTNATNNSLNYKLLQGKWQSTLDAKSTIEFVKNKKIDSYKGVGETSNSNFLLSDECTIIANPKKWNHIVLTESQFCYKIVTINAKNLEISFTVSNSTLKYKK